MYQIYELEEFKQLFHAFSTAEDGNMSLIVNQQKVTPGKVLDNRFRFFKKIGLDISRAMTIWLQHEDNVIEADEKWIGRTLVNKIDPPKADAVITNKKNLFLCLTVADCVPIILFDPFNQAIGLVHAGWKGTDKKIVVKTIKMMEELYGSHPKNMIIGIGPSVRKDSYIKKDPVQKDEPSWVGFIEHISDNDFAVDVVGYIKKQLLEVGVVESNIFDCGIDTAKDPRFFSHSHNKQNTTEGRLICLLGFSD